MKSLPAQSDNTFLAGSTTGCVAKTDATAARIDLPLLATREDDVSVGFAVSSAERCHSLSGRRVASFCKIFAGGLVSFSVFSLYLIQNTIHVDEIVRESRLNKRSRKVRYMP